MAFAASTVTSSKADFVDLAVDVSVSTVDGIGIIGVLVDFFLLLPPPMIEFCFVYDQERNCWMPILLDASIRWLIMNFLYFLIFNFKVFYFCETVQKLQLIQNIVTDLAL